MQWGAPLAEKDLDPRRRVFGRDSGPDNKQEEDEWRTPPANEPLQEACTRDEHNILLADNVRWRHGSDV